MKREHRAALAVSLALVLVVCARVSPPPGGEQDRLAPQVIGTWPDPQAVIEPSRDPVVFRFDERISEQGVAQSVLVSPETGEVRIGRGRTEVRVTIEGGWQADRIYHVVLLPAIRDLFGNSRQEPFELVFSTGPPIPETALAGLVTDRLTGRPASGTRVEAVRLADSLTYGSVTDTAGFFALRFVPAGEYAVRAYTDQNTNRRLDPAEPRDTGRIRLAAVDTALLTLAMLPYDTTAARLVRAEPRDSMRVLLAFDDPFDPEHALAGVAARLFRLPDSTQVQGAVLMHAHEYEALERARLRAQQDSARAAADSAALAADSAAAADTTVAAAAVDTARAPARAGRDQPGAAPRAAQDTARAAQDSAAAPLPGRELILISPVPLEPETRYVVEVEGVTNISGLPGGGGTAEFETPAQAPPADTTAAPAPDTTAAPAADTTAAPPRPDTTAVRSRPDTAAVRRHWPAAPEPPGRERRVRRR